MFDFIVKSIDIYIRIMNAIIGCNNKSWEDNDIYITGVRTK